MMDNATNKNIVILRTKEGDFEAVYVDGILIESGHKLDDPRFWWNMGATYGELGKLFFSELSDDDDKWVMDYGYFPLNLHILKGQYV